MILLYVSLHPSFDANKSNFGGFGGGGGVEGAGNYIIITDVMDYNIPSANPLRQDNPPSSNDERLSR